MDLDDGLPDDGGLLLAARYREFGQSAELRRARADGSVVRVRRGVYTTPERAAEQRRLDRYRDRASAAALQRRAPVLAGFTAAVFHGLPVVGRIPEEIFVLSSGTSGRRRNGVVEIARRGTEAIEEVGGRALTSLPETVIEVARRMPLLTALVMADAAIAVPRYGGRAPRCSIEELTAVHSARLPYSASRAVRAVLARASPEAETPLESLSRLRIEELGFPEPLLQFAVRRPGRSEPAYLDFAWPDAGVWGEADGRGKYLDPRTTSGGAIADAVLDEKRREDEIRSVTGWRCVRWEWRDAWEPARLRDLLLRAGLRPR